MHTPLRLLSLLALLPLVARAQPQELSAPPPPAAEVSAPVATAQELAPKFTLWTSPLTVLMAGAVLEGEVRLNDFATAYGTGEFYGLWMGWGFQAGTRLYPGKHAMRGFFVDLHARANNLYVINLLGGGVEVGGEHRLGNSRWAFLWSVGADIGMGTAGVHRGFEAMEAGPQALGFVAQPKLRLMLGYQF
jgi:hypothetical protein